ncbi:MAG: tol-pal system YbgF family protein [Phycisphaerae bacterium]
MTQHTQPETGVNGAAPIVDVWSRTSRRHRVRAILMLVLLSVLFAGLCCFTFWLRTGTYSPWEYDGYRQLLRDSFNPVGPNQITLSDFLSDPIRVQDVPIHAVIMGLQFAAMVSIPILVAILYRLPFSVAFAAMVFFLAAMPWLGITVMIGCTVACTGPFRFTFRFASVLMGLIPVAIYFVLASLEPAGAPSKLAHHKALLYAPWVLALLSSCLICALALAVARLINYRPGGIPPILAMLFAIPVLLFHAEVGRDELEYRILERRIGPGNSSIFASVDVGQRARRAALRQMSESEEEPYEVLYERLLRTETTRALQKAEDDRHRAIRDCDAFIEHFPDSRYVPSVLFLKARALDFRVDRMQLARAHRAEFRSDLPSRASRRTWQALVDRFSTDVLSEAALYYLAILKGREGDLDGAIASLGALLDRFNAARAASQPIRRGQNLVGAVFRRAPVSFGLGVDPVVLAREAERLREMLIACRNDRPRLLSSLFGPRLDGSDVEVRPIQVLLWLDDADPHYRANLEGIARAFPDSEASGYVAVRLALLVPAVTRRISRLRAAAEEMARRPSGAEIRFCLGDALQGDWLIEEARAAYEGLVRVYPDSCWAREARGRLTALSGPQEGTE